MGLDGGAQPLLWNNRALIAEAAANASPLTFHQSDMSEMNPGLPSDFIGVLSSCTRKRSTTFRTQSGDLGILSCPCLRSSWICRYGEQGNGAAPRDARAASFRESAQGFTQKTHNAVAGTRGQCVNPGPTKHLRMGFQDNVFKDSP